jgi:hypothetical protein
MSYRFIVPNGGPDASLLSAASAQHKALGEQDAKGFIAWRGQTSRGVFVFEEDGHAHFKLPVMASVDDVALATELAIRHALARNLPIDVEEPMHDFDDQKAPAGPAGYEGGNFVRPEELQAWPDDWFEPHAGAGFIFSLVKQKGAVWLSGPHRRTFLGMRSFGLAAESVPDGASNEQVSAKLREMLTRAQEPERALLPLMPRFVGGEIIEQKGFFSRLVGKGKLQLPKNAPWSPSPFNAVVPAFCHEGDIRAETPERRSQPNHTIALSGQRYQLPLSDYVALRESEAVWSCVPFATFMEALGPRFEWLDDFTAIVDAPGEQAWQELLATLAASSVGRIAHEPDFDKTSQELLAAAAG